MACKVSLFRRMPREVPLTSSMAPLRARRGRGAGAGDGALDKIEDLLLAISQFGSD